MKKRIRGLAGALCALALVLALAPAVQGATSGMIDLNAASEAELVSLPGVGPAKAKAIVEYRQTNPFRNVEELMNVRGIGESTFANLKDKITVGSVDDGATTR